MMGKKNIVSIEDRIPKLKQARKKKANRRLIFYLSVFFFLIVIIVYLQSSLSNVKNISVSGNRFMSDKDIIALSGVSSSTNIWTINKTTTSKKIEKNPIIESVTIDKKLPWTISIHVSEYDRVGYASNDGMFYPILGNGQIVTEMKQKTNDGNAPILIGFSDHTYVEKMSHELGDLPKSILKNISEIHWQPTKKNKNKIMLYMNDGHVVDSSIRHFAKNMASYPSIAKQLKNDMKGVIHIGVGAYFEPFKKQPDTKKNDK